MGKRNRENLVKIREGIILPYRTVVLLKRIGDALVDGRKVFGDEVMNKILLGFMEPEAGK